jgi:hypothetical protein
MYRLESYIAVGCPPRELKRKKKAILDVLFEDGAPYKPHGETHMVGWLSFF